MAELTDKVVVITGAGKGIGKGLAEGFASAGAKICCSSRTLEDINDVAAGIVASGGDAMATVCDVTDLQSVESLFASAKERYGQVDVVVINAGVLPQYKSVEESDPGAWASIINTNLLGAYNTARAAIPLLKESGAGKIIFLGSGLGHRGMPGTSDYACSKAAMWMLVKVLAQELSAFNISVNELVPGPVDTDMVRNTANLDHLKQIEWFKTPEDVLPLALFLASQPARGPTAQSYSLMRRECF